MEYIMSFLEGIITFISPCLLPMLPIYLSYFMGKKSENKNNLIINILFFILGFTIVFTLLGIFAGTFGMFVREYANVLNIIFGSILIIFGINFIIGNRIPVINKTKKLNINIKFNGVISSFLFGIIFSIGWTPCIGSFLGSALMLAATKALAIEGALMLLMFSLGLGIPFLISGFLINRIKITFNFIKKHYNVVNVISGVVLIIMGILMLFGIMQKILMITL